MLRVEARLRAIAAFALLCVVTAGCSNIRVTTEVYAPPELPDQQVDGLREALLQLTKELNLIPARASAVVEEEFGSFVSAQSTASMAFVPVARSYAEFVVGLVVSATQAERDALISEAARLQGTEDRRALQRGAYALATRVQSFTNEFASLVDGRNAENLAYLDDALREQEGPGALCPRDELEGCLDAVAPLAASLLASLETSALAPIQTEERNLEESIEHLPLGDERVGEIVRAKKRPLIGSGDRDQGYWDRYVNDVRAFGLFGNSEISIVMRSLGSYSLKGVVFDPSQVSQATLDATAHAVNMIAAAYGVPVRAGVSEDQQPPLSLPEIEGKIVALEEAGDRRQARMGELFNALLEQDSIIVSNATASSQKASLVKLLRESSEKIRKGE